MDGFIDDAVLEQAVRLADGCARSDVEIFGLEIAPGHYALTGSGGRRAQRGDPVNELLQDATSYLLSRRLALLRMDSEGPVLVLRLDRFKRTRREGAWLCEEARADVDESGSADPNAPRG